MRAKRTNFFAKILIFFSLILISCGLGLQIVGKSYSNPINFTKLENENDVSISITDKSDILDEDVEENKETEDNDEESNDSKNSSTKAEEGNDSNPAPSTSPVPSTKPVPSIKPTPSVKPTPSIEPAPPNTPSTDSGNNNEVVEKPLTIEETNARLRDSIQSTYGVTIKYGNETSGYSVGGLSTNIIPDAAACQKALNDLNSALALYPSGFFNELANNFNPLTFYLVKNYSKPSVTGVTSSYTGRVDISIAIDYGFGDTFHHEVYHYIEYYMKSKGFAYISWTTLYPVDFSYGTINQSYSYDSTFSEDSYFVNSYAQTSPEEDRASTFEYMMSANKASCLNQGKVVWSKAKAMSEAIDYYLNSVSPSVNEYWERFVY